MTTCKKCQGFVGFVSDPDGRKPCLCDFATIPPAPLPPKAETGTPSEEAFTFSEINVPYMRALDEAGRTGLDGEPGDEVQRWAHHRIRTLERELNEAKEWLKYQESMTTSWRKSYEKRMDQLADLTAQRDRARAERDEILKKGNALYWTHWRPLATPPPSAPQPPAAAVGEKHKWFTGDLAWLAENDALSTSTKVTVIKVHKGDNCIVAEEGRSFTREVAIKDLSPRAERFPAVRSNEEVAEIVGTGFYRDAKPGTFGRNEWLDLLMACQDGRATCMRALEIIEREMDAVSGVNEDAMMDELANSFLRWPLPKSVCADLCATQQDEGRVGTNLLSFVEAKQMFRDVVGPRLRALQSAQPVKEGTGEMPHFGACCAKPPVAGKIYNLILDDDDMPPHVHSYRSIQKHLVAALEMLDDGEDITLKITRKDMTQEELNALPEQ